MMLCETKRVHPLIAYLRWHEWEWIPESVVIRESGCSKEEIEEHCAQVRVNRIIERRDGEMRYISNTSNYTRRIVETLKREYPRWLYSAELQRKADVSTSPGRIVSILRDLLPVEWDNSYDKCSKTYVRRFRYVPNDKRSLMDFVPRPSKYSQMTASRQEEVVEFLHMHPGVCYSAREICTCTSLPSAPSVAMALLCIRKRDPTIQSTGTNSEGILLYSYNPNREVAST